MQRARWRLAGCALAVLLSACAGPAPTTDTAEPSAETTLFYGTNRNRRDDSRPKKFYGEQRGALEYGVAEFSVEKDMARLQTVTPLPRESFLQALHYELANVESPEILVFVHGYLRSFAQSARVVAQFSQDTGFRGVPMVWSWPSTSNPTRYTVDETSAKWARADFAIFLRDIIQQSGAQTVHLVGHSLGGRSLVNTVLYKLLPAGIELDKVGQFVLLAPDIDRDIFARDLAPRLRQARLNTTLYTANNDLAMHTAYRVHGHRRAGDSSEGPLLVPGIQTIDVTAANRSVLGHSYFEESEQVSRDLAQLLNSGVPAERRIQLEPVQQGEMQYWRLTVDK